jgi:hypothetical protein
VGEGKNEVGHFNKNQPTGRTKINSNINRKAWEGGFQKKRFRTATQWRPQASMC